MTERLTCSHRQEDRQSWKVKLSDGRLIASWKKQRMYEPLFIHLSQVSLRSLTRRPSSGRRITTSALAWAAVWLWSSWWWALFSWPGTSSDDPTAWTQWSTRSRREGCTSPSQAEPTWLGESLSYTYSLQEDYWSEVSGPGWKNPQTLKIWVFC